MNWLNQIHCGDCRLLLAAMAADGVVAQTCVTSPPYYGLRDYGTAEWEGGDPGHAHEGQRLRTVNSKSPKQMTNVGSLGVRSGDCACGARRVDRQIGLEQTPDEYVDQLVAVFSAVRQVLADDGTLWLNLGDSYAGNGGQSPQRGELFKGRARQRENICLSLRHSGGVLKAKNLIGIPWRVAFALQADGWYLRSDIIWSKPNPMPESVTDRPTKAHEYVFLLAKQERYYYAGDTIAEPATGRDAGNGFDRPERLSMESGDPEPWVASESGTRNARTVWTLPTQTFRGSHFATFPEALVGRCIAAGSPPGGVVLDPFMGSGTTAMVATDLGCQFVGCELNPEYVQLAARYRRTTTGMPF